VAFHVLFIQNVLTIHSLALIPPSTLLLVIPLLPFYTTPAIGCRTFSSGLKVLHTPQYTHAAFSERLTTALTIEGPKSTREIAELEAQVDEDNKGGNVVTIGLAEELIDAVEAEGRILRDLEGRAGGGGAGAGASTIGEALWWVNLWQEYVWDGET
jgi:ESCRT-II complex subunit VPS36